MQGLVEEGSEIISEDADPTVKDAGLIGAARCVEHHEIAGYSTTIALATHLGHEPIAEILSETLEEEKETDAKLTDLAETLLAREGEMANK
jgi:ferritin-like metal-binding protein YciE